MSAVIKHSSLLSKLYTVIGNTEGALDKIVSNQVIDADWGLMCNGMWALSCEVENHLSEYLEGFRE